MIWLWILLGYSAIAMVVGILYGRSEVKELIAQPEKFKYPKRDESDYNEFEYAHSQKPRSEEDRVRRCAESVFWESWWTGVAWPLYIAMCGVFGVWTGATHIIAGDEIKKARALDEEKKARKILEEWDREQKKKFDGL